MALTENVRRVVTTVDKSDKAVVLLDGPTPHKKIRPVAQTVSRLIWVTDQTPADLSGTVDRAAIDIGIMPPAGGSVFRIVEFPPEPPEMRNLDPSVFASLKDRGASRHGRPPARHPNVRRSRNAASPRRSAHRGCRRPASLSG